MTITVISDARNNAELIAMAAKLGYLRWEWITLDPTYGKGAFWKAWRPAQLVASDLYLGGGIIQGQQVVFAWDFANLPVFSGTADAVVFDPPYKLNGTSTGKGASAADERYGVAGPYRTVDQKMTLCFDGIKECMRVLAPGGCLLIKCQDQVVSGRKVWQTRLFADMAEQQGGRLRRPAPSQGDAQTARKQAPSTRTSELPNTSHSQEEPMSRESEHTCHAEGCDVHVPPKMFMCLRHWRMIPKARQNELWWVYEPGQEQRMDPSDEYLEVSQSLISYVAAKEGR